MLAKGYLIKKSRIYLILNTRQEICTIYAIGIEVLGKTMAIFYQEGMYKGLPGLNVDDSITILQNTVDIVSHMQPRQHSFI